MAATTAAGSSRAVLHRQEPVVGPPQHGGGAGDVVGPPLQAPVVGPLPHEAGLGRLLHPQCGHGVDVTGEGVDPVGVDRSGQVAEGLGGRLEEQVGHRGGRAQAERPHQHQASQQIAAVHGQVEPDPAAQAGPHHQGPVQLEGADQVDVVEGHVAHVVHPDRHVGPAEAGVDGGDHAEVPGQLVVDGAPGRGVGLGVEEQQRRPVTTPLDRGLVVVDQHRAGGVCHVLAPGALAGR